MKSLIAIGLLVSAQPAWAIYSKLDRFVEAFTDQGNVLVENARGQCPPNLDVVYYASHGIFELQLENWEAGQRVDDETYPYLKSDLSVVRHFKLAPTGWDDEDGRTEIISEDGKTKVIDEVESVLRLSKQTYEKRRAWFRTSFVRTKTAALEHIVEANPVPNQPAVKKVRYSVQGRSRDVELDCIYRPAE